MEFVNLYPDGYFLNIYMTIEYFRIEDSKVVLAVMVIFFKFWTNFTITTYSLY